MQRRLPLHCDSGIEEVGIETDPEGGDIFRVLEVVRGGSAVISRSNSCSGSGDRSDDRQAAVQIGVKEPELCATQFFSKPSGRDSVLPQVTGSPITGALYSHSDRGVVAGHRCAGRIIDDIDIIGGSGDPIRAIRLAETEQHEVPSGAGDIGDGKEGPDRFETSRTPAELVKALQRDGVGKIVIELGRRNRHQRFLDLGAGCTKLRQVDRIDAIQSILDEGAFTPVDHLTSNGQGQRVVTASEVTANVRIE